MAIIGEQSHQSQRSRQSGPTAKKKCKSNERKKGVSHENNKQHNPKVLIFFNFYFNSVYHYVLGLSTVLRYS
uniref:Putative ovule protein n=1 Tax=Solanum chacoense TaxID=4108 RepID=A0A0V0HUI8_SOLCH